MELTSRWPLIPFCQGRLVAFDWGVALFVRLSSPSWPCPCRSSSSRRRRRRQRGQRPPQRRPGQWSTIVTGSISRCSCMKNGRRRAWNGRPATMHCSSWTDLHSRNSRHSWKQLIYLEIHWFVNVSTNRGVRTRRQPTCRVMWCEFNEAEVSFCWCKSIIDLRWSQRHFVRKEFQFHFEGSHCK